jgi:hypothetical protein
MPWSAGLSGALTSVAGIDCDATGVDMGVGESGLRGDGRPEGHTLAGTGQPAGSSHPAVGGSPFPPRAVVTDAGGSPQSQISRGRGPGAVRLLLAVNEVAGPGRGRA